MPCAAARAFGATPARCGDPRSASKHPAASRPPPLPLPPIALRVSERHDATSESSSALGISTCRCAQPTRQPRYRRRVQQAIVQRVHRSGQQPARIAFLRGRVRASFLAVCARYCGYLCSQLLEPHQSLSICATTVSTTTAARHPSAAKVRAHSARKTLRTRSCLPYCITPHF
jgi:hypothetical protein